ncbi:MAG: head GIN domain-containing protein [Sphingomonas sp.]
MIRLVLALVLLGVPSLAHAATRTFTIGSFERLRVNGPFAVTVTTGQPPSGSATGSLDAVQGITLEVDGDTLVISMGARNWTSDAGQAITPPTITVSTPSLKSAAINSGALVSIDAVKGQIVSLTLNGSGTLTVGKVTADQFAATIVGTGAMTLAGTAGKGRFIVSGPGSFDADKLIVGDLTARSDGSGEMHLAARYTASVTTTGLGPVTVAGSPSCTVRAIAGGPVQCGNAGD